MIKTVFMSSTTPVSEFTWNHKYGECDFIIVIFKTPNGCGSKLIRGTNRVIGPRGGRPPDIISYESGGNTITYEYDDTSEKYSTSSQYASNYGIIRVVRLTSL